MITRLFCIAGLLLSPGLAHAEDKGQPPPICTAKNWNEVEAWRDWASHTPPANVRHWAAEKERWRNSRDVWRVLDRLYIAITGGKVAVLADCPFTDSMYFYLYERYDPEGRFHVVRTVFYEDHVFALVMQQTGRLVHVPALPVWSPDRKRFAYAACSVLSGAEDLAIMRPVDDGIVTEIEAKIPCGLGDCTLVWESGTALTATCTRSGDQGNDVVTVRFDLQARNWIGTTAPRK